MRGFLVVLVLLAAGYIDEASAADRRAARRHGNKKPPPPRPKNKVRGQKMAGLPVGHGIAYLLIFPMAFLSAYIPRCYKRSGRTV